ncbi:MAG: alanyl-tRNA editing protein [Candidatus Heimdallarchaeota archaeon]|nr:alanyl-tRNA editing protein [Candidatus Heimdallarchaeota archaeon]
MEQNDSYPIYWSAPYQKEAIARITEIKKDEIKVNQTLFYPSGGGQLADKGIIVYQQQEIEIVEIEKKEDGNWLKVRSDKISLLAEGEEVLLKLDWDRRYSFMKSHTAQHLVSHVLEHLFDVETLKANFEEDKIDIEISRKMSQEEILEVLKKVNRLIDEGAEVKSIMVNKDAYKNKYRDVARGKISDEEVVRLIQLGDGEGFDITCCGGVHITNLSEIKGVFLDTFKGDSLKFLLDAEGIDTANNQRALMLNLEELTEKRGNKLVDMLTNKMNENQVLQEGNLNLLKMLFSKISNWSQKINGMNIALLHLPEIDRQALQSAARELEKGFLIVVLGRNDILYFISTDETIMANDINAKIIERTSAKGGGNKGFAQVNVKNIEEPLALVQEVLSAI